MIDKYINPHTDFGFKRLFGSECNKELLIIPGAVHTDLYDRLDVIPFDKMEAFFRQYMG